MLHKIQTHSHTCVHFSVSASARSAVVLLVARLQDCVEAVCNKCAQASGPKKIYHKQEGRQSAQGKEEDGANGVRGEQSGRRYEEKEKGDGGEKGGSINKEKVKRGQGLFLLGLAMFPIM